MSTDEKIAAVVAAHPPLLRDANPGCVCGRNGDILEGFGGAVKPRVMVYSFDCHWK
ncbi:MAG: hypothetical protein J0I91_09510 [Candidatus Accumulibacter sp.]|nr:hypothetical protein [Accumulibacter sp.]